MRAHMLSMLSLTPPATPAAHPRFEAAPAPARAKAPLKPALFRPLSLSSLIHKTALLLHP